MSIDPFDDDNGSFFVLANDEELHSLWPASFQPTGWWSAPEGPRCASALHRTEPDLYIPAGMCAREAALCYVHHGSIDVGRFSVCPRGAVSAAPVFDLLFRLCPGRGEAHWSRVAEGHRDA